ncbi:MAG: diguanylate cyclase, partial [Synergistaceae bacterium]|nr:diguanylate cyclase [Synergistaceae bacterium]
KEGARKLAAKLLQLAGRIEAGPVKGVSLSLGIAELEEDDTDLGTVLVRADEALYRAKEKGKSQVSD